MFETLLDKAKSFLPDAERDAEEEAKQILTHVRSRKYAYHEVALPEKCSEETFAELVAALTTNDNINSLCIPSSISSNKLAILVEALPNLNAIKSLAVIHSQNEIFNPTLSGAIAQILKTCLHITALDLSKTNLDDTAIADIAEGLAANTSLMSLSLADNKLTVTRLSVLLNALRKHNHLQSLNLDSCSINNYGAQLLASYLEENPPLVKITLRHNQIGNPGVRDITTALRININLAEIYLEDNYFDPDHLKAFLDMCQENYSLTHVHSDVHRVMEQYKNDSKFQESIKSITHELIRDYQQRNRSLATSYTAIASILARFERSEPLKPEDYDHLWENWKQLQQYPKLPQLVQRLAAIAEKLLQQDEWRQALPLILHLPRRPDLVLKFADCLNKHNALEHSDSLNRHRLALLMAQLAYHSNKITDKEAAKNALLIALQQLQNIYQGKSHALTMTTPSFTTSKTLVRITGAERFISIPEFEDILKLARDRIASTGNQQDAEAFKWFIIGICKLTAKNILQVLALPEIQSILLEKYQTTKVLPQTMLLLAPLSMPVTLVQSKQKPHELHEAIEQSSSQSPADNETQWTTLGDVITFKNQVFEGNVNYNDKYEPASIPQTIRLDSVDEQPESSICTEPCRPEVQPEAQTSPKLNNPAPQSAMIAAKFQPLSDAWLMAIMGLAAVAAISAALSIALITTYFFLPLFTFTLLAYIAAGVAASCGLLAVTTQGCYMYLTQKYNRPSAVDSLVQTPKDYATDIPELSEEMQDLPAIYPSPLNKSTDEAYYPALSSSSSVSLQ